MMKLSIRPRVLAEKEEEEGEVFPPLVDDLPDVGAAVGVDARLCRLRHLLRHQLRRRQVQKVDHVAHRVHLHVHIPHATS